MNISHVINAIESYAPRSFQEKWDNSGLQIALPAGETECTGVLLCLDVNEDIVAEAAARGCNLIVSHHPLIFKGFKNLTGSSMQQRAAIAAVRAGIAVYSAHTSLDSTPGGVSYAMASLLGAEVTGVLEPAEGLECVLSVICPRDAADDVRLAMLDRDAGAPLCAANIPGQPDSAKCASADSTGYELPRTGLSPFPEIIHKPLCRMEATVPATRVQAIISAVRSVPRAADTTFSIASVPASQSVGLGVFAVLPQAITGAELVERIRDKFGCKAMRASGAYSPDMKIRRLALCGGSGGEFIGKAINAAVDAYITADVRYHDFADIAKASCAVFDIGHFESESCAKSIFYHVITKKFPNFAVYYSEKETNPVQYL